MLLQIDHERSVEHCSEVHCSVPGQASSDRLARVNTNPSPA